MDNERRKDIAERCLNFGVMVVQHAVTLPKTDVGRILVRQFVRSGTSVGANVEEAIGGQSRKDFAGKLAIAYKEARETRYWLSLLKDTKYISQEKFDETCNYCEEITRIVAKIQKTTRDNS